MQAFKIIFVLFGLSILIYIYIIWNSELQYNEIDYNHNGFVTLGEAQEDLGKREIKIGNNTCIEYFFYKDGSTATIKCDKILKADLVVVKKSKNILSLSKEGVIFKEIKVSFGANPIGRKTKEGDERTPEGNYILDYKKPDSGYYKAIHISYPNEQDSANAKKLGVNPGGLIMIHGQKNNFGWLHLITQRFNWTNGCIGVKNDDMEYIWKSVDKGIPIIIYP